MSKKGSLYEKDNWLHGWTGGDTSFLDIAILKDLIDNYYTFSKQQAQIYINKYAYKPAKLSESLKDIAHDISLYVLVEITKNISSNQYIEQGKMEPYIRVIVKRKVVDYINHKIKYENYENIEILDLKDDSDFLKEKYSLEDFMKRCEEEMRQSNTSHIIDNLDLLFKQKFEDKSIEELAVSEETSVGGIKSRLRLARKMLEDCIKIKKNNSFEF